MFFEAIKPQYSIISVGKDNGVAQTKGYLEITCVYLLANKVYNYSKFSWKSLMWQRNSNGYCCNNWHYNEQLL